MKKPDIPKPLQQLVPEIETQRWGELISHERYVTIPDDYMHWDDLRRRPAPEGLTHAEWWMLLKMRRMLNAQRVPLRDKAGEPFAFSQPVKSLELLHEIDRGLGASWRLPEIATNPATRDEYIISSLIQESITSSLLEGAATTREVAKEMLKTGRPPRDKSERMVLNNYRTMQRIMEIRDQPLSPELVFELHRQVTEDTLEKPDGAGRFRRANEAINVFDMEGNVFHAPPPADELPRRMKEMCDFANNGIHGKYIHPIVRAIILHFWLAYDHPFIDGNGRTARALFYWAMLHSGYDLFEFISISQILLNAPAKYSMAFLHTETDDNDLTYFLLHQADVIKRAAQALQDYVAQKTARLRDLEKQHRGFSTLNHRQRTLLTHALRKPETLYTVASHRDSHLVATQTARTDLDDLVARRLFKTGKLGRTVTYRAVGDLSERLSKTK